MQRVMAGNAAVSGAGLPTLRRAVLIDAMVSGPFGLACLVGAEPIGDALGLATALVRWAGVVALGWGAVTGVVGTRGRVGRGAAWVVVGGNLVWVVGSLMLLASGRAEPTALGSAVVLGQAAAVAALTGWQYAAMRQAGLR